MNHKLFVTIVILAFALTNAKKSVQQKDAKINAKTNISYSTNNTKNNTTGLEINEINLKVVSIKDCKNKRDSLLVRKISYPKTIKIPGTMELNATGVIKNKLPKDWNIYTDITVDLPVLGLVKVPCEECIFKNICNENYLNKCKTYLKNNKNSKLSCNCDLDVGTHDLPKIEVPLSFVGVNNTGKVRMINNYSKNKGTTVKLEILLKSAIDNQRFGCFNAVFQVV